VTDRISTVEAELEPSPFERHLQHQAGTDLKALYRELREEA
jgi:hypothetical protein